MRKLLIAGCLILALSPLKLASSVPIATADEWEEVCIRWHVTGEWSYSDSVGAYGVMNFIQDENDNLTGSWQNQSAGISGSIQGTLNGTHLTFNTHPREQNWSTVDDTGSELASYCDSRVSRCPRVSTFSSACRGDPRS